MNRKQRRKTSKKKTGKKKSSAPASSSLSQEDARALFNTAADKMIAGDLDGATPDLEKLLGVFQATPVRFT
jgi:hypothetical protein